jgi:hypothetical protein
MGQEEQSTGGGEDVSPRQIHSLRRPPHRAYAMSRISVPPVASKLTLKDNPVVAIGVDRRSVGGDNGVRGCLLPALEKG